MNLSYAQGTGPLFVPWRGEILAFYEPFDASLAYVELVDANPAVLQSRGKIALGSNFDILSLFQGLGHQFFSLDNLAQNQSTLRIFSVLALVQAPPLIFDTLLSNIALKFEFRPRRSAYILCLTLIIFRAFHRIF